VLLGRDGCQTTEENQKQNFIREFVPKMSLYIQLAFAICTSENALLDVLYGACVPFTDPYPKGRCPCRKG